MPIINVGYGFLRQGLCIFMWSQNLWDFALDKKNKTKQKDLATSCGAMGIVNHRPTLIIAETLQVITISYRKPVCIYKFLV